MSKMDTINERMNSGMYINYSGNEIYNKPFRDQNNYDEYIEWINPSFFDREIHSIKSNEINSNINYENLNVLEIEILLNRVFSKKVELISISKSCYNGEIIWTFYYRNSVKNKEFMDEKMYLTLEELDKLRYCEIPLFIKARR